MILFYNSHKLRASIRYDPQDITTIWVYRQEGSQEIFLTRAHALRSCRIVGESRFSFQIGLLSDMVCDQNLFKTITSFEVNI
ncbi:MAG: Mu transposase C-terminal domain-containing protein [Xenococcus sp. (in: cyanobacteria)]